MDRDEHKWLRETLVDYFERAAGFRKELIPKDQPWNPKNEKYATCLNAVLAHIRGLPNNDSTLQILDECDELTGRLDHALESSWQFVIHCDTRDPAAWFTDWAKSLIEEAFDPTAFVPNDIEVFEVTGDPPRSTAILSYDKDEDRKALPVG